MSLTDNARTPATPLVDFDRIDALNDAPVAWAAKGFPFSPELQTIRELVNGRTSLFAGGFMTPFASVSASALDHNLRTMADYCSRASVLFAPHGKTTMAPKLFARQLELGAWGITVATAWQARVSREFGVANLLLASQLADVEAIRWAYSEFGGPSGGRLISLVDSRAQVEFISTALREAPEHQRPLDMLVEVGYPGGRTGARTSAEAADVAEAIRTCPRLRLVGVAAYEGLLGRDGSNPTLGRVRDYLAHVKAVADLLDTTGAFDGLERVILTSGGSAYFDLVVESLAEPLPVHGDHVDLIIRSGCYVTHDDQLYREVSPFTRRDDLMAGSEPLRQAITVWASVISHPEPGLVLLNVGKRDVPTDIAYPRPSTLLRHGQPVPGSALDDARVTATNDQHAYLELADHADVRVGDVVGLRISHPCTFFDRWKYIPIVDDDQVVVDVLATFF